MPLLAACFIRSAFVPPPPERNGAVVRATAFGCAENCLPFAASARFFVVVRFYSLSVSAFRACFGK